MRFHFVKKWLVMRTFIFVFSLLAFFVLVFPENAYSQDTDTALPEYSGSESAEDPYALATDEQIEEAQTYYETCQNNEAISARKNCECAAAAYLETRIKLGESATFDEIMAENVNTCLVDEDDTVSDVSGLDLDKVTKGQMEEAEQVYLSCAQSHRLSKWVDCECLGAKFLDMRIKRGPMEPRGLMVNEITQKYCRNIVQTTGLEFQRCMEGSSFKYYGIRPKDYCECYARMWGKLYKNYDGRMDETIKKNIRAQARSMCSKPDMYK